MSKKLFTEEEIKVLSKNPYVKSVSSKGITYTEEFKHIFIAENEKGKLPRQIFEECGFDVDVIGMKFGYNSVLTGIALTLYMSGPYHWVIVFFGAAITAFITASMMHAMKHTEIPVLTAPYIILTWFILLVSYRLQVFKITSELVPQDLSHWELVIEGDIDWTEGAVSGIEYPPPSACPPVYSLSLF